MPARIFPEERCARSSGIWSLAWAGSGCGGGREEPACGVRTGQTPRMDGTGAARPRLPFVWPHPGTGPSADPRGASALGGRSGPGRARRRRATACGAAASGGPGAASSRSRPCGAACGAAEASRSSDLPRTCWPEPARCRRAPWPVEAADPAAPSGVGQKGSLDVDRLIDHGCCRVPGGECKVRSRSGSSSGGGAPSDPRGGEVPEVEASTSPRASPATASCTRRGPGS